MFPKWNTPSSSSQREWRVRSAKDLANAIAEARRRQHLTQADLAEAAELDRSRLAKIELGTSTTLLEQLLRLLNLLGLELVVRPRDPHRRDAT